MKTKIFTILITTLLFLSINGCQKSDILPRNNNTNNTNNTNNINDTIVPIDTNKVNVFDTIVSVTCPIIDWQPGIRSNPDEGYLFNSPFYIEYITSTGGKRFYDPILTVVIGRHTGVRDTLSVGLGESFENPVSNVRLYTYRGSIYVEY